jgi:hypothetical protein
MQFGHPDNDQSIAEPPLSFITQTAPNPYALGEPRLSRLVLAKKEVHPARPIKGAGTLLRSAKCVAEIERQFQPLKTLS